MNGKVKGGLTIGGVSGISIFGIITIFNLLTNPIKDEVKEVKTKVTKVEVTMVKEDKEIKNKVESIESAMTKGVGEIKDLIHAQTLKTAEQVGEIKGQVGKINTRIDFIQKDIEEIKKK